MNEKIYLRIKILLFIIIGILIIVFSNPFTDYAHITLGVIMVIYGLEDILFKLLTKRIKNNIPKDANDILIILLGIISLFLGPDEHFTSLCIIWATWTILREEWEIEETVFHLKNKVIAVISFIESIAVITISVFFIFEPTLKNVHIHVILLGIELILEVLFPFLSELLGNKKNEEENN